MRYDVELWGRITSPSVGDGYDGTISHPSPAVELYGIDQLYAGLMPHIVGFKKRYISKPSAGGEDPSEKVLTMVIVTEPPL